MKALSGDNLAEIRGAKIVRTGQLSCFAHLPKIKVCST